MALTLRTLVHHPICFSAMESNTRRLCSCDCLITCKPKYVVQTLVKEILPHWRRGSWAVTSNVYGDLLAFLLSIFNFLSLYNKNNGGGSGGCSDGGNLGNAKLRRLGLRGELGRNARWLNQLNVVIALAAWHQLDPIFLGWEGRQWVSGKKLG